MNIIKRFIVMMLFVVLLVTSACGKDTYLGYAPEEPVTIYYEVNYPRDWIKWKVPYALMDLDAVENFQNLNTNITVVIQYQGENDASEESVRARDIIQLNTSSIPIYAEDGMLMDLNLVHQSAGSKPIDIDQAVLDEVTIDSKLLLLPYAVRPLALMYYKDLFDVYKIPYPEGTLTWEQFRDLSKQFNRVGGKPLLAYTPYSLNLLMASLGKSLISPDGSTSVGYLDSPEAVRAVQFLNGLYDDFNNPMQIDQFDIYWQFDGRGLPMLISDLGMTLESFVGEDADTLGLLPLPYFEGGQRANPSFTEGFGILSESKNPKAAWKFIEYLTLLKNEDSVKRAGYFLTTSETISKATNQNKDPNKRVYLDELEYVVKKSNDYNPYFYWVWDNFDIFDQFERLILVEDKDIQGKLSELAIKYDKDLNRLLEERKLEQENATP